MEDLPQVGRDGLQIWSLVSNVAHPLEVPSCPAPGGVHPWGLAPRGLSCQNLGKCGTVARKERAAVGNRTRIRIASLF